MNTSLLAQAANEARGLAMDAVHKCSSGHLGLPLGAADIGAVLFGDKLVCVSLLVFYVFAMQCVSTLVIVKRETGSWKWACFQLAYLSGTAWLLAFAIFQIGRALGW